MLLRFSPGILIEGGVPTTLAAADVAGKDKGR